MAYDVEGLTWMRAAAIPHYKVVLMAVMMWTNQGRGIKPTEMRKAFERAGVRNVAACKEHQAERLAAELRML